MTRILVTGATGFIGSNLVRRLLARPDAPRVAGLVRTPARAEALASAGMEVVPGDVTRRESLEAAVRGADVVVHLAAVTGPAPVRRFERVIVGGTRDLLEAARAAGVRRFVHVSSQAVLFGGLDLLDVDEDTPPPPRYIDPYSRTKAQAERLAMAAHAPGFETTAIRPCLVWGRGDTTVLPHFVRLSRGFGIPMPGTGDVLEATTHVENLVDALLLAAASPAAPGRVYYVADGFEITLREFLERQIRAVGVEPRFRRVPYPLAAAIAWLVDVPPGRLGLTVQLARFGLRSAVTGRRVRIERARRELGYEPRIGLEEGLAAMRNDR